MSLKGTEHDISLKDVPKVRKAVADRNIKLLTKYAESGVISTEIYNQLMEEFRVNPNKPTKEKKVKDLSKLIKGILCIVLALSLSVAAVVYHNNAIDNAYYEGINSGYTKGYDKGYDEGYGYYKKIKNEYNFFHKYAVIVTKTGKRYHKYDCYHIKDRTFYIYNISMAKSKGYTPCLDCYD